MNYMLDLIPVYVKGGLILGAYLIFLCLFFWKGSVKKRMLAFVSRFLLGEYFITLFSITVSPMYGFSFPKLAGEINLMPCKVLSTITSNPMNFFGNVFLFFPLGLLIVFLSKKYWSFRSLLIGTYVSVFIEVMQLFNNRGTDIDDVILNTIGYVIGWMSGICILKTSTSLRLRVIGKGKKPQKRAVLCVQNAGFFTVLTLGIVMIAGYCDLREYNQVYAGTLERETEVAKEEQFASASQNMKYNHQDIEIDIAAQSAIVVCQETGEILWQKNAYEKMAPASCTKILTAMVTLDYCEPTEIITVGDELEYVASDATKSYLYKGCELTVRQALVGMLVPSGNDSAYALAAYTGRKIAGDNTITTKEAVDFFVDRMNEKAKEIGATSSHFTTPDGYDEMGQFTTAYDLAVIGEESMKDTLIAEIVSMPRARETWISGEVAEYDNTNEMLMPESEYYVENCVGLKTGTTGNAGACLVSAYSIDGKHFVSVLLNSTREERFEDGVKIYNSIFH